MKTNILFVLMILSLVSFGQTLPDVVSFKTPEAAAFDRNIEVPVSTYTGIPDISIPLYTISIRDVNVPITLSYHAGGIRVDQEATWVGLGWDLNYGGQISRKTRGQRDENEFFQTNIGADPNYSIASFMQLPDYRQDNYLTTRMDFMNSAKSLLPGSPDYLPDEFYFNVLGNSGRFMYNQGNHKFVFFPKQDVAVDNTVSNLNTAGNATPNYHISHWDMSLPNGVSMQFGEENITTAYSEQRAKTSLFYDRDTWKVSAIYNTYSDGIQYYYSPVSYSSDRLSGESYSAATKQTTTTVSNMQYNDSYLYRINFSAGYITFTVIPRDDMPTQALSEMDVYDYKNNLIKRVNFFYSYFSGSFNSAPVLSYVNQNYENKRLRLDSVYVSGNNVQPLKYKFDYYTSALAPSKDSYSQDFWGFYNGASNVTMVPYVSPTWQITNTGNRNPNPSVSNVFSLKSIVYPTGGKTVYTYEGNTTSAPYLSSYFLYSIPTPAYPANTNYVNVGGLRVQNISWYDNDGSLVQKKAYSYDGFGGPGTSSGHIASWPRHFQYLFLSSGLEGEFGDLKFYANSITPLLTTSGSYVGYQNVTEQTVNPFTNETLDTKYTYSVPQPFYDQNYLITNEGILDAQEWKDGKLLLAQYLKKNVPVKTETYQYYQFSPHLSSQDNEDFVDEINQDYISHHIINNPAIDFYDRTSVSVGTDVSVGNLPNAGSDIQWFYGVSQTGNSPITGLHPLSFPYFQRKTGFDKLQSKSTTTYDDAGHQITETDNYFYERTPAYYELTRSQKLSSKGDTLSNLMQYPIDFKSSAPYDLMVQRNMLSQVIFQKSMKNSTFLASSKTNYLSWPVGQSTRIAPVTTESTVGNYPTETRVQYYGYDGYGNPSGVSKVNDVNETYLWGYNGQYPVAKIIGTDYNTASSYVNNQVLVDPPSDQQLRDEIDKIRAGLNNQKVMVYTYTYAPMVGITSQTDPAGKITYYQYDGIGRLLRILDMNNNIIRQYEYHQQGDPTPTIHYNSAQSMTYGKSCPLNQLGSLYTTSVPANMFTSISSDDDANQQALNYIKLNGQYNANKNGTCTALPNLINLNYYVSRGGQGISFILSFTDLSTNQTVSFQTTGMSGYMGAIMPGNYAVQITCPALAGGVFSYGFNSASQENVTVGNISNISITAEPTISLY